MLSTVLIRPSPSIAAESLRRNRSQPRARVAASGLGLGCVKSSSISCGSVVASH
jgi:hypothetical protein